MSDLKEFFEKLDLDPPSKANLRIEEGQKGKGEVAMGVKEEGRPDKGVEKGNGGGSNPNGASTSNITIQGSNEPPNRHCNALNCADNAMVRNTSGGCGGAGGGYNSSNNTSYISNSNCRKTNNNESSYIASNANVKINNTSDSSSGCCSINANSYRQDSNCCNDKNINSSFINHDANDNSNSNRSYKPNSYSQQNFSNDPKPNLISSQGGAYYSNGNNSHVDYSNRSSRSNHSEQYHDSLVNGSANNSNHSSHSQGLLLSSNLDPVLPPPSRFQGWKERSSATSWSNNNNNNNNNINNNNTNNNNNNNTNNNNFGNHAARTATIATTHAHNDSISDRKPKDDDNEVDANDKGNSSHLFTATGKPFYLHGWDSDEDEASYFSK
eukprot:CAMPEP_0175058216 /NCGR_PEP_ID=MMETSP0052_2-20121109/11723_1 /TAXON_ID=51329 ORGANISM="Polytomella parva, Strain SAG 63-3" /NCGR_SAMPLE_ID=MMETSP0052_2 /ASSEMBLY_ACC=CAM_ASM_000194 /LENGTH=381 /DNA_ID=CAMNT_0016323569 /DNA_START=351 /DNA_END=1496 /DNA_ORIENTATION=-